MKYAILAVAALAVSGCATVVDGTTQLIQLETNVEGSSCSIFQDGAKIKTDVPLPGTVELDRRMSDLILDCQAEGYEPVKMALVAGGNPLSVVGHMTSSLLVGGALDAALGGVGEYQNQARIHFTKKPVL
ncbi:MAG: hypothetical protein AAF439_04670 [Pseudomonadota bacterium]